MLTNKPIKYRGAIYIYLENNKNKKKTYSLGTVAQPVQSMLLVFKFIMSENFKKTPPEAMAFGGEH